MHSARDWYQCQFFRGWYWYKVQWCKWHQKASRIGLFISFITFRYQLQLPWSNNFIGSSTKSTREQYANKFLCNICISSNTVNPIHEEKSWKGRGKTESPIGKTKACWKYSLPKWDKEEECSETSSQPILSCWYSFLAWLREIILGVLVLTHYQNFDQTYKELLMSVLAICLTPVMLWNWLGHKQIINVS